MDNETSISPMLAKLDALCPAGYAIALHIKFTTPTYLFQSYSKDWMEYYSQKGWVLHDPVVHWGFENTGVTTWGDLKESDPQGVLEKAVEFGMAFGAVISLLEGGSRTIAGFARGDRNYSDGEIHEIRAILQVLHDKTLDPTRLSDNERAALTRLSVTQTHS